MRWLVASVLLLLAAGTMVARYIPIQPSMSRVDEYVYIDAVDKATHGQITRRGDLVGDYALMLISCRGVEGYPQGAACGGEYTRETVPWSGGHTTADIHPPTYFFLTAGLSALVLKFTSIDDLLTAARLTSALWLGLGLIGVVALARALGASRQAAAAVALLTLVAPSMRWEATFVTPDAMNLLVGSAIALAAVQYAKGRWSPWVLVAVSAVAGTIKAQNLLGVVFAALCIAIWAVRDAHESRSWRPLSRIGWGMAAGVGAAIPQAVWFAVRAATAVGPPPDQGLGMTSLSLRAVANGSTAFMRGVIVGPNATYPGAWSNGSPLSLHGEYISWIFIAGAIALALLPVRVGSLQRTFGLATLALLVLGGPLLRIVLYVSSGANFAIPDRYGVVLLPAMAAAVAVTLRNRWLCNALIALGIVFMLLELTLREPW